MKSGESLEDFTQPADDRERPDGFGEQSGQQEVLSGETEKEAENRNSEQE